jgi:hypothetical protein
MARASLPRGPPSGARHERRRRRDRQPPGGRTPPPEIRPAAPASQTRRFAPEATLRQLIGRALSLAGAPKRDMAANCQLAAAATAKWISGMARPISVPPEFQHAGPARARDGGQRSPKKLAGRRRPARRAGRRGAHMGFSFSSCQLAVAGAAIWHIREQRLKRAAGGADTHS